MTADSSRMSKCCSSERLEHDFAAPGQLLGDIGEFRDLLGRMAQGQFEQRTLVFVEGHLGRGGTGVDC